MNKENSAQTWDFPRRGKIHQSHRKSRTMRFFSFDILNCATLHHFLLTLELDIELLFDGLLCIVTRAIICHRKITRFHYYSLFHRLFLLIPKNPFPKLRTILKTIRKFRGVRIEISGAATFFEPGHFEKNHEFFSIQRTLNYITFGIIRKKMEVSILNS